MSKSIKNDLEKLVAAHNALLDQIDVIRVNQGLSSDKIDHSKRMIAGAVNSLTGLSFNKLPSKSLKDIEYAVIELVQNKRDFVLLIRDQSGLGIIDVGKGKIYKYE